MARTTGSRQLPSVWVTALGEAAVRLRSGVSSLLLTSVVVLVASWQITLRSEDPTSVARALTQNLFDRTAGDLAQYRPLSHFVVRGLALLEGAAPGAFEPYLQMRLVQGVLLFGLASVVWGALGLQHRTRLLGLGLLAGLVSLNLGALGPSTFSLDRFTDAILYLVAALLVLHDQERWIPAFMVLAVANRETSVFIPTLVLARHGFKDRRALLTALVAWIAAAATYLAIHAYYGPQPRTEESYFGPAMLLHSLSLPGQVAYFFAMVTVLPVLALVSLRVADPFLRRLFWWVVPTWFALHIWAARPGEGMLFLAPITLILVPLILQGLERRTELAPVPRRSARPG